MSMLPKLPKYYGRASNGNWTYKGRPIAATSTCSIHGTYPALYIAEDGRYVPIDGKRCPYCHAAELIERELGQAMIPPRFLSKSFDSFVVSQPWQQAAKEAVMQYAENFENNLKFGTSMILLGGVGTGKTHLSVSLLRHIISEGHSGMFISASDLFMTIRESWGDNTTRETIGKLTDLDLLVIDEVGVQRGTDNEREIMFSVLNSRYNHMRPTILLSNKTKTELKQYIGLRVYDRMKENQGQILVLNGESQRK